MEAKRLGNVYEPEPSSEVSNQTTHCESTQNENPMQNEQHNKIIELVELDKTFQEPNGPNTRNENMNHVVGAAVSGHPDRTSIQINSLIPNVRLKFLRVLSHVHSFSAVAIALHSPIRIWNPVTKNIRSFLNLST
jgi:hypothetical protein